MSIYPLLEDLGLLLLLTTACSVAEFLWSPQRPTLKNVLFNFGSGALALPTLHIIQAVIAPVWIWLHGCAFFPGYLAQWPAGIKWAAVVAALLSWDFFQYWAHRAQHRFPWLWRFHHLHHSDKEVSGSTSARNHLLNHLANLVCIAVPMALLFPASPLPAWCVFLFFRCYGFFNHTLFPIELGPLAPVLSGPRFHRVHHGAADVYHDKNFAAFFPILDILFGTYYKPAKDEIIETGVAGCDAPNSFASLTIEPIAGLWKAKSQNLAASPTEEVEATSV